MLPGTTRSGIGIQHEVIGTGAPEMMGRRQTCLARADDEHIGVPAAVSMLHPITLPYPRHRSASGCGPDPGATMRATDVTDGVLAGVRDGRRSAGWVIMEPTGPAAPRSTAGRGSDRRENR